ncbi:adenine deaminase [Methylotuvimicrobium alcaliphilum 20Z]|uniref:Adenine deaminase n=1 Tax=Methylotuvimicrobium alcaliphilum (strain DSM 19304 / NCIMB 14124 / VKM B-2133 / 20Z) TaxID=1091494 RepID=G4SXT2_META2|nr:adenine deaminase [Methylotuvimicrobium alcaliphilum 20Z]
MAKNVSLNQGSIIANVVQILERRIVLSEIGWDNETIASIIELGDEDPDKPYLLPGFIDAHVHIESSMLTPDEFARIACRHGTVAAVSDPHEIANVLGLDGIRFMCDSAALTPMPILFGAPSCVPATPFETAGARLDSEQLAWLFENRQAGYLSEVMNYPGVLHDDPDITAKLALAKRFGYPIDGHAPGLSGEDVKHYAAAGISTDHECSTLDEAREKLAVGMHILIREGSAARNFEALHPLIDEAPERVMLCSDDKHPDDLVAGHINVLVARAVAHGHSVFDVLRCACWNPVDHYNLPVGRLRVGERMDAVLVENLADFSVLGTWVGGQKVAEHGKSLLTHHATNPVNRFAAAPISASDLEAPASGEQIRVIKAFDGELFTQAVLRTPKIVHGQIVPDIESDRLLLTVVNRYEAARPALAFIEGFGLQRGALASSVAHDSHNVIAVGADSEAICLAVNAVIAARGGIAVADRERVELLPLPIAGLMSDADGDSVAARYADLDALAKRLGSPLRAPFMTLSFMALLVIPELKLSDRGLFDGRTFSFTPLTVTPQ